MTGKKLNRYDGETKTENMNERSRTRAIAYIIQFCLSSIPICPVTAHAETVQLIHQGGEYLVPVRINGAIILPFILDTGATNVAIPGDVFLTLRRTGTVKESDHLGSGTVVLADGSEHSVERYVLHELKVGDHVVGNVIASVSPARGDPLLGQSFLSRLPGWAIDNLQHTLIIGDSPASVTTQQHATLPPPQDTTPALASPTSVLNPSDPAARAAIIRGQQIAQSCFNNYHAFDDKMYCLTRYVKQDTDSMVHSLVPNNQRFEMLGFSFYCFIVKGQFEETIRNQNYDEQFIRSIQNNVMEQAENLRVLQRIMFASFDDLCRIIQVDCSVAKRLGYYWGAQVQ
jgi:clan AA aspartic protease (TIGR02281 family)